MIKYLSKIDNGHSLVMDGKTVKVFEYGVANDTWYLFGDVTIFNDLSISADNVLLGNIIVAIELVKEIQLQDKPK